MSAQTQLNLTYSGEEDPQRDQLDLFPKTVEPPEPEIHFLVDEIDPEVAIWRRRALFSTSIFLHIILIILVIFAPDILRRAQLMLGIPVTPPKASPQVTTLFLPPDLQKSLRKPPPEAPPSDKNREAEGRAPKIDPNGIRKPYAKGNTPEPEIKKGEPQPAPTPAPPASQAAPPPPAPKPEPPLESRLRMEDVTPPNPDGAGKFRMPNMTPGQVIQQSLQGAAKSPHSSGEYGDNGDSNLQFNNLHPNFSTEAPTILSDTMGVDFGPYLARIVHIVRENWIAGLPESARLGEKGRVGIVFEILRDGTVPQLRMVASSGADPLDRAAINGIHSSAPFPPLPQEFTGPHLVLQFIFLYNLAPQ